ncbi:MAG: hypothetical protein HY075_16380 [Deltaproteobacteria bacterium]|nr:hypothetical protein [Deltaproteobacteria bacterium]
METILGLLERKNLCFRSFNKLCFDFLAEIAKGETRGLEEFQRKRESLIKVLEQLEFEVNHCLREMGTDPAIAREERSRVEGFLREKDALVKSIVDLDLQILAHIDRIKDETIHKLQSLQSGRKTVNAYRSPLDSVEAAEGTKILDHEA